MPTCSPIRLAQIGAPQRPSRCHLEQLFARLRPAGLVRSVHRYSLTREAEAIPIGDILVAVQEPIPETRCNDKGGCMGEPEPCRTRDLRVELGRHIALFLDGVTLADVLADQVTGRAMDPSPAGHLVANKLLNDAILS